MLILGIIEIANFGTLAGFAVSQRIVYPRINFGVFLSYLTIFVSIFLILFSFYKIRRGKIKIVNLAGKFDRGLIKLEL